MSGSDPTAPLLETRGVTKAFSGVPVLQHISLSVHPGEVHAVMGENGAGKSTLMKVLAGEHLPDAGEIWLKGRRVQLRNPHAALRNGIAMIYQELLPVLDLTVAENIFLGHEPASRFFGWIEKRAMNREAERLLAELGVAVSPRRKMRELRVSEMQVTEIARALAHSAEIIIMDEPTSALSDREIQALFRIITDLRRRGGAVIYISHKLDEVFRLADRITVLRDGRLISTQHASELTSDRLVALMVGRELVQQPKGLSGSMGDCALAVRGLGKVGRFHNVSFEVRTGEVLGIAGLMGAGRTDVVNALYGLDPADSGEIQVHGRTAQIRRPRHALQKGIGLVTEDRKTFGLVPTMGVKRNVTLASLRRFCRWGLIDHRAESRIAAEQSQVFAIKMTDQNQPVLRLSGGNQQKVVLARTLLNGPDILLLDEPTRGIDIAAKAEIHALIRQLARGGKAVVLVSSELPELLALSDRLLVMRQGRVAGELDPRKATQEEILRLAMPQGEARHDT